MSERQLRRRFADAVGYGPKTLARVLRFQRFLALAGRGDDLAGLAFEAGYADQAHLTRECRRLSGRTPAELVASGAGAAGERLAARLPQRTAPVREAVHSRPPGLARRSTRERRVVRPQPEQVDTLCTRVDFVTDFLTNSTLAATALRTPAGVDPLTSLTGAVRRRPRVRFVQATRPITAYDTAMIEKAEEYIWANARVLEQRRFELLFKGGAKAPSSRRSSPTRRPTAATGTRWSPTGAARRASRRTSGPRWRPSKTPAPRTPTSATTCRRITAPDGGVPVALPSLEPYPHAPWWRIGTEGSLLATSLLYAPLARHGVEHPWLAQAESFCWAQIDAIEKTHPYEVEAAHHVP